MIMWIDRFLMCVLLYSGVVTISAETQWKQPVDSLVISDNYGIVIKNISDTTITYVSKKRRTYTIEKNSIFFSEGEDSLKSYIYNRVNKDYECNTRELIIVFFDSELRLKEIRMANISPLCRGCRHRRDYIRAVKQTKGMWKKNKKQDNYIYVFSIHVH